MNKKLRAALVKRADGDCEACGWGVWDLEADHFFSRRIPESMETVWMLCRSCHRDKTDNFPSNAGWVTAFLEFARKHDYPEAIHRCEVRLEVLHAKGMTP